MSIYTRTGDKGTTSLYGGKRVSKSDLQVEAYGSVDELTSHLGLIIAKLKDIESKIYLIAIQKDLYQIMAFLSGASIDLRFLTPQVESFEKKIDELEKKLPRLTRFILPGGTEVSALFHVARTTSRRAERNVVKFHEQRSGGSDLQPSIKYLNRLSDLFFIFARHQAKGKEIVT